MINHPENVNCRAFVSKKFFPHFSKKTFSAESGFELCRTIRSSLSDNHLPIILMLSGYLALERFKGMSAGADLLLHRPVVKDELFRMIQLLLGWRLEENINLRPHAMENRPLRRLHSVI